VPYDLQNYSVSFTRTPLSLSISATVTDSVTGQVKGTVSVSFPADLSLMTDAELRGLLVPIVQRFLHKKAVQLGYVTNV
jgi:hypothetical protein